MKNRARGMKNEESGKMDAGFARAFVVLDLNVQRHANERSLKVKRTFVDFMSPKEP